MAAQMAIAAVQMGMSIHGGRKAKQAAKEAAKSAARYAKLEGTEQIRRAKRTMAQQRAMGTAAVFASGIKLSGSSRVYMEEMGAEHARQLAWMDKALSARVRAIRKGGAVAADTAMFSGISGALSAAGQGIAAYGQYRANQQAAALNAQRLEYYTQQAGAPAGKLTPGND